MFGFQPCKAALIRKSKHNSGRKSKHFLQWFRLIQKRISILDDSSRREKAYQRFQPKYICKIISSREERS
ncbi:hypothetical protein C2I18_15295 [Paenibacillus sp. PK3_47]|nr:hypothetical protein C2I18_15295 [Paenibacillus sp. PK3_47]